MPRLSADAGTRVRDWDDEDKDAEDIRPHWAVSEKKPVGADAHHRHPEKVQPGDEHGHRARRREDVPPPARHEGVLASRPGQKAVGEVC